MEKNILIIDGSIWLYKNALTLTPLYNCDFIDISVIYYTLRKLYNEILKWKPDKVYIVFDIGKDIKKKEKYNKYKENRHIRERHKAQILDDMVYERLSFSRKLITDILSNTPIKVFLIPMIEGDTIIGLIHNNHLDDNKIIISSDKDLMQLIDDKTKIIMTDNITKLDNIYTDKDYEKIFEKAIGKYLNLTAIINKYNVNPISLTCLPYYRAFIGDISDDITGIKNIGIATIGYLIQYQQFKNITCFNGIDDFISFLRNNKEDIINRYPEITDLCYNNKRKNIKQINKFFEIIDDDDVINLYKIFFELMDIKTSIKEIPATIYSKLHEIIEDKANYDKDKFIELIQTYDLNSTSEYVKWDIINKILSSNNVNWDILQDECSNNINKLEILFNNLLEKSIDRDIIIM